MKKIAVILTAVIMIGILPSRVYGQDGLLGYFGGISEGTRLKKPTQQAQAKAGRVQNNQETLNYKEVLFITGEPIEIQGTLQISASGGVVDTQDTGTFTETYKVVNARDKEAKVTVSRDLSVEIQYDRDKDTGQVIKTVKSVKTWRETVRIGEGKTYQLDPRQSKFYKSVITDKTPGVTYYRGDLTQQAVYTAQQAGGQNESTEVITVNMKGPFYGYDQPYSRTEVQNLEVVVESKSGDKTWQLHANVLPSVTVKRTLQYAKNELKAFSMEGNYREIMENHGGMEYNIFIGPDSLDKVKMKGSLSIPTFNSIEQLPAINLSFLKAHFAKDDIEKLYSMKILDGDPRYFKPNEVMTRSQFIKALCKAINIGEEPQVATTKRTASANKQPEAKEVIFADVQPNHMDYPYIMAAYKNGLALGGRGRFRPDEPITRQEAFVVYMRVLGLNALGLDPTPITPFKDDAKIDGWAKQDIYASYNLGLIRGDQNGNLRPKDRISKGEGAALINRLIDYMREGMEREYRRKMDYYKS